MLLLRSLTMISGLSIFTLFFSEFKKVNETYKLYIQEHIDYTCTENMYAFATIV